YVQADRGRADDYYLTEGTGVARRFTVTEGRVAERAPLTGQAYETWVAGRDPDTGEPRGQLRSDAHAVRFVEVAVNGPKTWSLAAINGIGHAAMATDPEFTAALAARGYTTGADGEIRQLAGYVGPMSARHAQMPGTPTETNRNGGPRTLAKRPARCCVGHGTP